MIMKTVQYWQMILVLEKLSLKQANIKKVIELEQLRTIHVVQWNAIAKRRWWLVLTVIHILAI